VVRRATKAWFVARDHKGRRLLTSIVRMSRARAPTEANHKGCEIAVLTVPPSNPKALEVCRMPHRRDRPARGNFAGRSPRHIFLVVGLSRNGVLAGARREATIPARITSDYYLPICDHAVKLFCGCPNGLAHRTAPVVRRIGRMSRTRKRRQLGGRRRKIGGANAGPVAEAVIIVVLGFLIGGIAEPSQRWTTSYLSKCSNRDQSPGAG
jgi:hypothetical protein